MSIGSVEQEFSTAFDTFSISQSQTAQTSSAISEKQNLLQSETQKALNHLIQERDEFNNRLKWLKDISQMIEDVSINPRVSARPKMSKFVEIDCLLNTSEYRLKYAEFSVISSLKMTSSYCQNSIDDIKAQIKELDEQISNMEDQQWLAKGAFGGRPVEIQQVDNATLTIHENGLVDVVETTSQPYTPPVRTPRFKTTAERDEFIRQERLRRTQSSPEQVQLQRKIPLEIDLTFVGGGDSGSEMDVTSKHSGLGFDKNCSRSSMFLSTVEHEEELQFRINSLKEELTLLNVEAKNFSISLNQFEEDERARTDVCSVLDTRAECDELKRKKVTLREHVDAMQNTITYIIRGSYDFTDQIAFLEVQMKEFSDLREHIYHVRKARMERIINVNKFRESSSPRILYMNENSDNEDEASLPLIVEESDGPIDQTSNTVATYDLDLDPTTEQTQNDTIESLEIDNEVAIKLRRRRPDLQRKKHNESVKKMLTDMINSL